jgi:hypothetical protein
MEKVETLFDEASELSFEPFARKPLAGVTLTPLIHGDKGQQKHYLSELESLLRTLHFVFIDPARQGKNPVAWPSDADFSTLDFCVRALARALRKKKRSTYIEKLKLVDENWRRLHLLNSVQSLLKQALALTPKLPEKPEAVEYLDWIQALANRSGPRAHLAKRFLKNHQLLSAGKIKLSQVRWKDYEEILLQPGRLECDMEFPDPGMKSLVRYLEMHRHYSLWKEKVNRWHQEFAKCEPLYYWVRRRHISADRLNEVRLEAKRQAARERLRRFREKKIPEKRYRLT